VWQLNGAQQWRMNKIGHTRLSSAIVSGFLFSFGGQFNELPAALAHP
jgi:hypothetical protein